MSAAEIVTAVLLAAGTLLMLLAAFGILRLPDVYTRISAATKASTLGAALVLIGAGILFADLGGVGRSLATVIFLLMTAPVAAHQIARAAHASGVRFWRDTVRNELDPDSPDAEPVDTTPES